MNFSKRKATLDPQEDDMTNIFDFLIRLKTVKKGGSGLSPRPMRDALLAEYMGRAMHAKLNQAYRARRKRGFGS